MTIEKQERDLESDSNQIEKFKKTHRHVFDKHGRKKKNNDKKTRN